MFENLGMYLPNLLATIMSSAALSVLGLLLLSRGELLHSIVVSQASSLGASVVLALALSLGFSLEQIGIYPALGSVFLAAVLLVLLGFSSKTSKSKLPLFLMAAFVFCLALNYLITAAMPALESHFVSVFLGDIATASAASSWYLSSLSLLILLILVWNWKTFLLQSFWMSLSDTKISKVVESIYVVMSAFLIIEATRILGFLFTTCSILVFPLLLSITQTRSKYLKTKLFVISVCTHVFAFLLALEASSLPTSALLCVAQFVVTLGLIVVYKFRLSWMSMRRGVG